MKRHRLAEGLIYYLFVIVGWGAYAALSLRAPSSAARSLYHLSYLKLVEIQLTLILPLLVIWLLAAYGTAWLKYYAQVLGKAREAKGFRNLADGVFLLLAGLVAQSLLGTARSYFQDTTAIKQIVIEINYIQILFPLAAFGLIYLGSRRLMSMMGSRPGWLTRSIVVLLVVMIGLIYGWLSLNNPNRAHPITGSVGATFYLSDATIITTIIVPYILSWILGALACYNLFYFSTRSKGLIYRRSLRRLTLGLIGVLALSVIIQLIGSVGAEVIKWSLGQLLMLIYILVALMAVGYVYIAIGASRLARIEEA